MLTELSRYAERHNLVVEPGFAPKRALWGLLLDPGIPPQIIDLSDSDEKRRRGREFACCPELSQPELKAGGAGTRHFLVDSVDVVLLYAKKVDAKLEAKHRFFVDLLDQARVALPELELVVETLRDPERLAALREDLTDKKAKPNDVMTFAVEEEYLVESDRWHDWWRDFRARLLGAKKSKAGSSTPMRCLVSGELVEPAPTHPKIKGLADVGGLGQGDVLASYKQGAFRSFGLVQSANAAVSEAKAAEYRGALNHLIATTGFRIAKSKLVYWYQDPELPTVDPIALGNHGVTSDEERAALNEARDMLRAAELGKRPDSLVNRYHILTLSGASGRVMVRDWDEGPFEQLLRNVVSWFDDLSIVNRTGSGMAKAPKLWAVVGALVRDLADFPDPLVPVLWRLVFHGGKVPRQFVTMALARVRSDVLQDNTPNHARFGLLKAYLLRENNRPRDDRSEGDQPMMQTHLNREHPSAAYQCGRLLAVLELLQFKALGDVGAGVIQRYYPAACVTPGLVLGRLVRNSHFHLEKIREIGLRKWHQGRIAEVFGAMATEQLPTTLTLPEQSLFALGYYQQVAADRAEREARRKSPESAPETPED